MCGGVGLHIRSGAGLCVCTLWCVSVVVTDFLNTNSRTHEPTGIHSDEAVDEWVTSLLVALPVSAK